MPLYEYQCESCHHRFEKIQSFSAADPEQCPKCGGRIERVLSAPAFQFKGSGWYATDYKKSGASKPESLASGAGSESASSGNTESKGESKSESKTETKTETGSKKGT